MPAKTDLQPIFDELKALLKKYGKGLDARDYLEGSTAREKKPMFGLLGRKDVAIGNRKPQRTYVVGIIMQKNFVGFYSMPIYSHPEEIVINDPDVAKMRKGKSCINVNKLSPSIRKDLERIVKDGIRIYKREGWI
jgi:hypothetical protein